MVTAKKAFALPRNVLGYLAHQKQPLPIGPQRLYGWKFQEGMGRFQLIRDRKAAKVSFHPLENIGTTILHVDCSKRYVF